MATAYTFIDEKGKDIQLTYSQIYEMFESWLQRKAISEDSETPLWKLGFWINDKKYKKYQEVYARGNKYLAFLKFHEYLNEKPTLDDFPTLAEELPETFEQMVTEFIGSDTLWMDKVDDLKIL